MTPEPNAVKSRPSREDRAPITIAVLVALCAALIAMPSPAGLPESGKRVIAVAVLAEVVKTLHESEVEKVPA